MYGFLHNRLFEFLEARKPWQLLGASVVITVLLGYIDNISGDYSFVLFYMIPIFATSWFVGKWRGLFICIVCAITNSLANSDNFRNLVNDPSNIYWDSALEFMYLLLLSLMFSTLKKRLDMEKLMARLDPLTGTLNRRSFYELAEYELNRAQRYKRPFTIVYMDLDNFKKVNDQLGHKKGDELLCSVVRTMRNSIRNTDIVARFGGDEFVLIFPETDSDAARQAITKLKELLDEEMKAEGWDITFSIGAVTYNQPLVEVDEMVSRADSFMYLIKSGNKDGIYHETIL
jgi:diguanylate cyclase (GGDEF)-like protein